MKTLLVGVIGHVDHGKTALVRALTGVETDRLKEERERGVSIVPGFALLRTTHRDAPAEIDLVDLPGHERFVRAMISGATGMGAVLLAIDAREGIKPQTVEHLEIARLIGVRRGVVALTKCDLLPPGAVGARVAEISGAIARSGLDAPVIATAIPPDQDPAGRGIEALRGALTDLLEEAPAPVDDGFPYLPVDRIFTRAGFGTIVTGTLRRGTLRVGDTVEIVPGGLTASVRSLQIHGRSVTRAEPGRRTAVALRGLGTGALERGQALCAPGLLGTNGWLDVALTAVASAGAPLPGGLACRLLFGTTEAPARLRLLDRDALEPGDTALAQIRTEAEIAVPAREPFLLRLDSPAITVAGGRILDPASRRRRRHDGAVIARLAAMAIGGPTEILTARLAESGAAGESLIDLARRLGCAPERVRERLAEIG
ncbi:selenocysteine-specific translation elongation factor, partial [Methylobacterium soli]